MRRSELRASRPILLKLSLALLLPLVGPIGATLAYGLLALWALLGPRAALEALTLSWILTHENPGLYRQGSTADLLRWLVLITAFTGVLLASLRRGLRLPTSWTWLLVFGGGAALLSTQGEHLSLSLMRLAIFVVGASTVLIGFHLSRDQLPYWERWFLTCFAVVVLLSLPLIGHDLGYVRNNRGFQGVFNQPQLYGVFLAPFTAWLIASRFEGRFKGWPCALLILVAVVSMVATQSRTAVFAVILALLSAFIWRYLRRPGFLPFSRRSLRRSLAVVGVLSVVVVFAKDPVLDRVEGFVAKSSDTPAERTLSSSVNARREFALASLQNFMEHPLTGIGFGVPTQSFVIKRDPLLGLPLSVAADTEASIEKSVNLIVLLEEVGILGALLFFLLLLSLLRPVLRRRGATAPLVLAATALLLTFGEAVFFMTGGTGMLIWLCIGFARLGEERKVSPS